MLITYSHLFKVLQESGQSYEQFAQKMGVSGMTLRRWEKHPKNEPVPFAYRRIIMDGVRQLFQEGLLPQDSKIALDLIQSDNESSLENTMKHLGINPTLLEHQRRSLTENQLIINGLMQIGTNEEKIKEVDRNHRKISSYKKLGEEWRQRIGILMRAIKSKKIGLMGKIIAYGGLFYLLDPFDLIPDNIIGFGLIDDFAILGIAAVYCAKLLKSFSDT